MDAKRQNLEYPWLTGLEARVQQVVTKRIRAPTAQTILSLSIAELKCLTSLSIEELLKLRRNAALFLRTTTPSTLLDIWMGHREDLVIQRLTTGCSSIDQVLEGGLLSRGVTEIAGESGAGKTQLCLQLCLTVQLPQTHGGFEGGVFDYFHDKLYF
jgi:DNA-repair protein XRCC3